MPGDLTIEVDTTRLNVALDSLKDALIGSGQDAATVVQDETKRLARMIVAFVPPKSKAVGLGAVERDLKNLISEATPTLIDEIGSKYGVRDIRAAYVTEHDGSKLNLRWDHIDPTGDRLEEYHRQYRNAAGRIPKRPRLSGVWAARVVVPVGTRDDYIKKVQQHVGHWKATWAKIGAQLGDTYPTWISRHFSTPMAIAHASFSNPEKPAVLFGSRAGGNNRLQQQIQAAVRARTKAIVRRIRLILSGYSKDLARGMRAQARARNWSEPLPAIE